MGSVERVLVLGIVVVIVAILGIAVWGASDDDANGLEPTATDGGAVVQAPFTQPDGVPANITPPAVAPPSEPMSEIDRLKALRDARRNALAGSGTTQQEPGVSTVPDGGNDAAPGPLPGTTGTVAEGGGAGSVPLEASKPVNAPAPAPGVIDTPKVVEASKDSIYTVGAGDSLWKIAHKRYGSGDEQAHVDAILAANPTLSSNEYLKVGQKITLPVITAKVDPTRLPAEKQAAETGGRIYVVKAGDTLSAIAKKELGSSKRSNEIFELNRTRLSDPAKIVVGMKLTLPPRN
ncbi:MAG TPA: LysM peptidoglycan-binding domain-containing protein [Planctomycetota bacterium]|nr:LysM peptidoglycan-binding domain-containing protein [Planctomycetota bacterium]